jgi:hypothetical protein
MMLKRQTLVNITAMLCSRPPKASKTRYHLASGSEPGSNFLSCPSEPAFYLRKRTLISTHRMSALYQKQTSALIGEVVSAPNAIFAQHSKNQGFVPRRDVSYSAAKRGACWKRQMQWVLRQILLYSSVTPFRSRNTST